MAALSAKDHEKALALCRKWDLDNDGAISHDELGAALREIFPACNDQDVSNMVRAVDINGDGIVQYEEFIAWLSVPMSEKLSFEDHVKRRLLAKTPTGSAKMMGIQVDRSAFAGTEPSAPSVEKATSAPCEGGGRTTSGASIDRTTSTATTGHSMDRGLSSTGTSSPAAARPELSQATQAFLNEFTSPLLSRCRVLSEREASAPRATRTVGVIEDCSRHPGRVDTGSASVSLQRLHDGNFVIRFSSPVLPYAMNMEEQLLGELDTLAEVYEKIFTEFANALGSPDGRPDMVLQLPPVTLLSHTDRPLRRSPEKTFAAVAWALTRLPVAIQDQLQGARVEFFAEGVDLSSFTDALPRKLEVASRPLALMKAGRLASRHGSYDWLRKDNSPGSRLQRLSAFLTTQRAILAAGYELQPPDVPAKSSVSLPGIQNMMKGTRIRNATDALPSQCSVAGKHPTQVILPGAAGVQGSTVMEVAKALTQQGRKVVAVSAASAFRAGGGASSGGRHALEEAWCTMTTLLRSLGTLKSQPFRTAIQTFNQHIPTLACVVSPDVEIFRESTAQGYGFLAKPISLCGVISVAMFNRNAAVADSPLDCPDDPELYVSYTRMKFEALVLSAIELGAQDLVMPDAGCGVFQNDPFVVGGCLGMVLRKYQGFLEKVVVVGADASFFTACSRAFQGVDPRDPWDASSHGPLELADPAKAARFAHPGAESMPGCGESIVEVAVKALAAHPAVKKPMCHYGKFCRIQTAAHLARFSHPDKLTPGEGDDVNPVTTCEPCSENPVSPAGTNPLSLPPTKPGLGYSGGTGSNPPAAAAGFRGGRGPLHSAPASLGDGKHRPVCKYGEQCYNKNPVHLADFAHPWQTGAETTGESKLRKDTQASHELLDLAKSGKWPDVRIALARQPDIVNLRPEPRRYALIHYACFQIGFAEIENLLVNCGADPKLPTKDGQSPSDVLSEALREKPGADASQRAKDATFVRWVQRRAAGENIPLDRSVFSTSTATCATDTTSGVAGAASAAGAVGAAGAGASPASPAARGGGAEEPETERAGGVTMKVDRCLNVDLNGEYAELKQTHNGYPAYRKVTIPGGKTYLYWTMANRLGWIIDTQIGEDGRCMAYLGPSLCGMDPSRKSFGEFWKVYQKNSITGGIFQRDSLMSITKKS